MSQIILVFGVMAARSSSRSIFQSAAETFEVDAAAGEWMGTKTGTPPLRQDVKVRMDAVIVSGEIYTLEGDLSGVLVEV